jgi:hypothetical protein
MESKAYPSHLYSNITLDELVTYCVFLSQEEKKEVTFENIVANCYERFPDKFSLVGYPQWPDSARINKSWLRCRTDFKYIKGSVKSGFVLTEKGIDVVARVQKKLRSSKSEKEIVNKKRTAARSREEQFIKEIEKSEIFQKYLKFSENIEVSHFDFCDLLYGTLETSADVLNRNLNTLKEYASRLGKGNILNFLTFLEKKFSDTLKLNNKEKVIYGGGMNKRKLRRGK